MTKGFASRVGRGEERESANSKASMAGEKRVRNRVRSHSEKKWNDLRSIWLVYSISPAGPSAREEMQGPVSPLRWLALASVALLAASCHGLKSPSADDWQVSSVLRTIELGGAVTLVSDVHAFRAPSSTPEPNADDNEPRPYYFAYSQTDASRLSTIEATAKFGVGLTPDQRAILAVQDEGPLDGKGDTILSKFLGNESASTRPHLYSVRVPTTFLRKSHSAEQVPEITLSITLLLLHTSEPLPPTVGQTENQFLLWKGDASPIAVYDIEKARVKVKSSRPRILSYTTTPSLPADQTTKSGSTITFGPYQQIESILSGKGDVDITKAQIHYLHDAPVISLVESNRIVTISHWWKEMMIEDENWLRNDGASLKGHFSRIQHQMTAYMKRDNSHILTNLVMHLPPGARDAKFVDQAGNVSTSNFRPAPASPSHVTTSPHLLPGSRASILDFKPRYPILGGWNYSFTVGWNVLLSDGWQTSVGNSRYSVKVPFMTPITDVAVDRASLKVILPEGARSVQVKVPFAVDKQSYGHKWYFLDTTGSPVIELERQRCSERHGSLVTIEYTLSPLDHYRKVFVSIVLVALAYVSTLVLSKVDLRIKG